MKKFVTLLVAFTFLGCAFLKSQDISQLTAQCAGNAGDVMYLKDFVVNLDASAPGGAPQTARFALLLNKSIVYRFSICTAPDSEGISERRGRRLCRRLTHRRLPLPVW